MSEITEKQRRIYYQNIAYGVCNALDRIFAKRPGTGVVVGTVERPSTAVVDLMAEVEKRCHEWAEMKAAAQTGEDAICE